MILLEKSSNTKVCGHMLVTSIFCPQIIGVGVDLKAFVCKPSNFFPGDYGITLLPFLNLFEGEEYVKFLLQVRTVLLSSCVLIAVSELYTSDKFS